MAHHALHAAEAAGYIPEPRPSAQVPLAVLLVEDEPSDMMLAEAALNAADIECDISVLRDGKDVLPYLRRQGKYCDEPVPEVMLLDLSLPTKDGFEVLAELAENSARFGRLPIVILTGDAHCVFLKRSYGLNIAAYLTKPCTAEKIGAVIAALRRQS